MLDNPLHEGSAHLKLAISRSSETFFGQMSATGSELYHGVFLTDVGSLSPPMPSSAGNTIPQIARRYPRSSGVLGLSSKDTEKSTSSAGSEPSFKVTDDSGTENSDLCAFSGGSGPSSSATVNSHLIDSEARTHDITLAPSGSLLRGFTVAESHVDRQVRYILSGYGKPCSWTGSGWRLGFNVRGSVILTEL